MSSLTTKYNTKLRAAQQRNKELRAELTQLQVSGDTCQQRSSLTGSFKNLG